MKKTLFAAALAAVLVSLPVFAADPVTSVDVVNKDAVIDGVVSPGEWDDATKLTLNISDTSTWSGDGAGIVGDPAAAEAHTDADMSNSIRLMVKDGYLYYLEERTDSTPFFGAVDTRKPYTQDSTLIWFATGDTVNSLSVLATNTSTGAPVIYFNEGDNQPGGVLLSADAKSVVGQGFVLEAKIALSDIGLTEDALTSGETRVTYCCVNIYDDSFDGDSANLWSPYGYQLQYLGVNTWAAAPVINVIPQTTFVDIPEEIVEVEEAPVAEAAAETQATPTAPATFDASVIMLALAGVSGAVIASRKKH